MNDVMRSEVDIIPSLDIGAYLGGETTTRITLANQLREAMEQLLARYRHL